jgi:hypothetical protein
LRVLVRRRVKDGLGARLKSNYFLFCCWRSLLPI